MSSCWRPTDTGMMLRKGFDGRQADSAQALALFEQACDGDVKNACYLASVVHLTGLHSDHSLTDIAGGNNVQINKERAAHYSEKGCLLGHTWACINAARMYRIGCSTRRLTPVSVTQETVLRLTQSRLMTSRQGPRGCRGMDQMSRTHFKWLGRIC